MPSAAAILFEKYNTFYQDATRIDEMEWSPFDEDPRGIKPKIKVYDFPDKIAMEARDHLGDIFVSVIVHKDNKPIPHVEGIGSQKYRKFIVLFARYYEEWKTEFVCAEKLLYGIADPIVLTHCEICGNKLTDDEQRRYRTECADCIDHLREVVEPKLGGITG
ncbi:hypothetical protein D1872_81880 [compost metagenome]